MISKSIFITPLAIGLANGLAHLPPRVASLESNLGHAVDPAFSDQFYSDGGAGGTVGGYNWITLSDGRVGDSYPVHVSYAAYGTRNNDPTQYTIVGDYTKNPPFYHPGSDGSGDGVIISDPSDTDHGACFGPGPNTAMVRIPGNDTGGVTVWTVYNACVMPPVPRYNTFIEFNTENPDTLNSENRNLPAQRTVLQLFQSGSEPLYGTDGLATDGENYYLLALDSSLGYKLARVPITSRTDRTAYKYYYPSTQTWNSTIHTLNSTSSNLYTPPATGAGIFGTDLYYSPYFQTWLLTDSASDAFGAKYLQVAYSTSGNVEGPYADAGTLFKPVTDAECEKLGNGGNSYLVHSQPGWDESGKTLLVSWISCNTFTNFARITWEE